MGDGQYRGVGVTNWRTQCTDTIESSEHSSELRTKYLRISVQIYDNAICVLNELNNYMAYF